MKLIKFLTLIVLLFSYCYANEEDPFDVIKDSDGYEQDPFGPWDM